MKSLLLGQRWAADFQGYVKCMLSNYTCMCRQLPLKVGINTMFMLKSLSLFNISSTLKLTCLCRTKKKKSKLTYSFI